MIKILQARLQQYMNHEIPEVQAGFRKGRGTRDQIANICWIINKARDFQKNIYFCFMDYAKTFDWNLLKLVSIESGMPSNHLILCCPLLLLPSIFPSIRVFSNESVLHIRWPNTGASASASVLPMNSLGLVIFKVWSPRPTV